VSGSRVPGSTASQGALPMWRRDSFVPRLAHRVFISACISPSGVLAAWSAALAWSLGVHAVSYRGTLRPW